MRKLTTQDFIDRAHSVHGDKYCYSKTKYTTSKSKVKITCLKHGDFEQEAQSHLQGAGCPVCFGTKKHTTESFIQKARELHCDVYDYSKVEYRGAHSKIVIICPTHGTFEQKPNSHLSGRGCPICFGNKKHNSGSFIEKAKEVHGDSYDYSLVEYVNAATKVKIICPEHGDFEQKANSHLQGQGCPGCAEYGFDRTKSGFLYVLRSDCGQYMKIGITHNPKQRHNKLKRATPFSFKRIELIEGPGNQIANLEKELLSKYQQVGFTERFDGSTEWRLWDDSIRGYLA